MTPINQSIAEKGRLQTWYEHYWAQTWYRNTFLVQLPQQIGRALASDQEWNNLYDSGCSLTWLAMIVGIDPARLASELSVLVEPFFEADEDLPALSLTGQYRGLVWDQNRPDAGNAVVLPCLWHNQRNGYATVKIKLLRVDKHREHTDRLRATIAAAHAAGQHVVCGPEEHSHLVAGMNEDGDYFLWDPDTESVPVETSLRGKLTLPRLFEMYAGTTIEFWIYEVNFVEADPPNGKRKARKGAKSKP